MAANEEMGEISGSSDIAIVEVEVTATEKQRPIYDVEMVDIETTAKKQRLKSPPGIKGTPLELPPCNICNGKASGIHYGVNSCEACKGFFRRYLSRKEPYVCSRDKNCEISSRPRGNCSACRLQKCLSLGMSKDAVRQGRYTLEQRTKTIKAVEVLKKGKGTSETETSLVQNCLSELDALNYALSTKSPKSSSDVDNEKDPKESSSDKCRIMSPSNSDNLISNDMSRTGVEWNSPPSALSSPPSTLSSPKSTSSSPSTTFSSPPSTFGLLSSISSSPPSSSSTVTSPSTVSSPQSESLDKEVDNEDLQTVLKDFNTAYDQFDYPSRKFSEEQLQEKFKEAMEHHRIQTEVFGPLKAIPAEEYNEIFEATGLDIDGRQGRLLKEKELWEDIVTQYVGFAKAIPRFTYLSIQDQATILKAARFEFFMILEYKFVNPEMEVMVLSTGEAFHLEELCHYLPVPMMKKWFLFAKKIANLDLTNDETLLVLAISLTFSDRAKLDSPESVDKIQQTLVAYLRRLLKDHHGDRECYMFTKVIDMFIGIRELNNEYLTEYKKLCEDRVLIQTLPEMLDFLFDDT